MSDFLHSRYRTLIPYTPGEQPQDRQYIKLNTNEAPYPPAPGVLRVINSREVEKLRLYSDPELGPLKRAIAEEYSVQPENVFVSNGSDEALNFAFMAYGEDGIAYPDISYGFYKVFAALHQIAGEEKPLREDFSIAAEDYCGIGKAVVLANPNAPTGLLLPLSEIEKIAASNAGHVVMIDEAYIDFGGSTALPLLSRYRNLLIIQTFSKSRALAGARVGFAIGDRELIRDLETIRYSTNPYNVNRLSMAAAVEAVREHAYYAECCRTLAETREYTEQALRTLGFTVLPSKANFVFARHPGFSGEGIYKALRERGILVRHFSGERIRDFNRISIGTREEMKALLSVLEELCATPE